MHSIYLFFLAALLVFTMPEAGRAQDGENAVRPAKVHTVEESRGGFNRVYPAIVYPSQEVELSFRVSGRLVELPIRASVRVERDGVVAQLDTRDFETEVQRLESQREEALAQLTVLRSGARPEEIIALEAAVEAAQAQVDQTREEYLRTQQLAERGVASSAQFQQREAAFRSAEAELVSREEQLTIGRLGGRPEEILAAEAAIRGLEAQIQTAKDNLADATLRAPFSGTIARRNVENFRNVQAGETIALIQNLTTLEIGYDLPGTDIIAMSNVGFDNIESVVTFDAMPSVELEADLVEFTTQADAATQTYRGRLSVQSPEDIVILPGMVARVILRASTSNDSFITVPLPALGSSPDGSPFVWRVDPADNTVQMQAVEIGDISGESVVVSGGLEAGSMVVTAGLSGLREGMQIRPVSAIGE